MFLSPCWEGGRARAASCKHPRRSQALRGRAMGTPPTPRLGEKTGGLWVPGYVPDGAGGSARTSSGGWRHLNPLSQEEARPSAVQCLPSDRSFSLPRVSGCAPMAVLCRCYFFPFLLYLSSYLRKKVKDQDSHCFCTVILTIRGRYKGILNPGDGSQQTCDKSHLISYVSM